MSLLLLVRNVFIRAIHSASLKHNESERDRAQSVRLACVILPRSFSLVLYGNFNDFSTRCSDPDDLNTTAAAPRLGYGLYIFQETRSTCRRYRTCDHARLVQ